MSAPQDTPGDRTLGRVTVLSGERGGRYPHGNSLLVAGSEETMLIDPSLSLAGRASLPFADRVLNSHCHEDHVAGNHLYPNVPLQLHEEDLPGIRSLDAMMAIYGMSPRIAAAFRQVLVDDFHYQPRPDAVGYRDGDVFDLGDTPRARDPRAGPHPRPLRAARRARGRALPRRHRPLELRPVLRRRLVVARGLRAHPARRARRSTRAGTRPSTTSASSRDRAAFRERLDRFTAVIGTREARLLEFLAEPRTVAEIVAHRFVYRPGDRVPFADDVERRSMTQHLARLEDAGRVVERAPGLYVAS